MCTFMFQGLCFHHLHHQRRSFRSCKAGTVFGFKNHNCSFLEDFWPNYFYYFIGSQLGGDLIYERKLNQLIILNILKC